jgi:hypothetical protein
MRGNSETYPAKRNTQVVQYFAPRHVPSVLSMMSTDPSRFVGWAYEYLSASSRLPRVLFEPDRGLALNYFDSTEEMIPHVSWKPRP